MMWNDLKETLDFYKIVWDFILIMGYNGIQIVMTCNDFKETFDFYTFIMVIDLTIDIVKYFMGFITIII